MLTSIIARHDLAVREAIRLFLDGEFLGSEHSLNISDGAVGYSDSGDNLTDDMRDTLDNALSRLVAELDVPADVPTGPPSLIPHSDRQVVVTWDGESCSADPPTVEVGDVIEVSFDNADSDFTFLGITEGDFFILGLAALPNASNVGLFEIDSEEPLTLACFRDYEPLDDEIEMTVGAAPTEDLTGSVTGSSGGCAYVGPPSVTLGSKIIIEFEPDEAQGTGFYIRAESDDGSLHDDALLHLGQPGDPAQQVGFRPRREGTFSLWCDFEQFDAIEVVS